MAETHSTQRLKDYRDMSEEELRKQIVRNNFEIAKSYGAFSKIKTKSQRGQIDVTGGIPRRMRKENARIWTIINERRNGIKHG